MLRRVIGGLFTAPLLLLLIGLAAPTLAAGPRVVILPATGIVDSVLAGYLADGISGAEASGAAAVVVRLDTPGGSLDATRSIVSTFLGAKIPVIVWVAPAGGRAASAGTFITLAANLSFMAPGTNIGAASPVDSSGQDIGGTLGLKIRNDAIASITAIAVARGRPVDWAVATVSDARSSPASAAVAIGAVDGIAATIDEVLRQATGRTVTTAGVTSKLDLVGSTIEEQAMNPFQAFLHLVSDPNIAFLLLVVGLLGLFVEFLHPNFVTGIIGGLALILAFTGFGSLPLNVAGLLLIGLAVALFLFEATVTSHGILAIGGVITFALGASALYTGPENPFAPVVRVGLPILVVTTGTLAVAMSLIVVAAVRSRQTTLGPGLVGTPLPARLHGIVRRTIDPLGSVHAAGEDWSARSADGHPIARGTLVRIIRRDGLTLVVESMAEPPDGGTRPGLEEEPWIP